MITTKAKIKKQRTNERNEEDNLDKEEEERLAEEAQDRIDKETLRNICVLVKTRLLELVANGQGS